MGIKRINKLAVKVNILNRQKAAPIPKGIRLLIRRSCVAVLMHEKFTGKAEVSVSFVDDNTMRELNYMHREKNSTTDVLSFPLRGADGVFDVNKDTGASQLGDIVISVPRAIEQAYLYGHTLQREIGYLTVHSMLHLFGYDHEETGIKARMMREIEEEILVQLGLRRDLSYV